jgi:hypothetical protein
VLPILRLYISGFVEIFYLPGYPDGQSAAVEPLDRPDAAYPRFCICPKGFPADSIGANGPDPGDDNATFQ